MSSEQVREVAQRAGRAETVQPPLLLLPPEAVAETVQPPLLLLPPEAVAEAAGYPLLLLPLPLLLPLFVMLMTWSFSFANVPPFKEAIPCKVARRYCAD